MSQPQKQDCHTLQRVDLARPFLVSPAIKIEIKNRLEMALSKAKSGRAWQSHFWQCGTLRPARNTKLFTLRKYRGGPHMRSLISIDFPAPEMEPESAHVVSAVSVP